MTTRFTLPQACACGARGKVTFEAPRCGASGDAHAHLKVVDVDGPFRLVGEDEIACIHCEGPDEAGGQRPPAGSESRHQP